MLHSKNTLVSRDPEKGPLGPSSIPGQRWPGNKSNWPIIGSEWPRSGSYFASSWLISGSTMTRNGVWPQWTLFRVTLTRVFLECRHMKPVKRLDRCYSWKRKNRALQDNFDIYNQPLINQHTNRPVGLLFTQTDLGNTPIVFRLALKYK